MPETVPPSLPKEPEFPSMPSKRRIAPRIIVGCAIVIVVILVLLVGSVFFFFATARKGHDWTMAEYVEYFEAHQDCFYRMAELEDAGQDSTAAPCVEELDVVSVRSKPATVTMYLFFNADFRSFVYMPDVEPSPIVKDLDKARRDSEGGGSAFASLGNGWYLRYIWD